MRFINPRWSDIQLRYASLNIAPSRSNKSNNQCVPIEFMSYYIPLSLNRFHRLKNASFYFKREPTALFLHAKFEYVHVFVQIGLTNQKANTFSNKTIQNRINKSTNQWSNYSNQLKSHKTKIERNLLNRGVISRIITWLFLPTYVYNNCF